MQWSDFNTTYLSAAQQTKAAQLEAIGRALELYRAGKGPKPDISAVTMSQAKAAKTKNEDIQALLIPAVTGTEYVIRRLKDEAADAFDAANP
jgi:hypothetical protein